MRSTFDLPQPEKTTIRRTCKILKIRHKRSDLFSRFLRHLIQRIAGPRGHLSNDQACELVRKFASPRLKKLYLAHLSHQCNAVHLAIEAMKETFKEIGRADIELEVAG